VKKDSWRIRQFQKELIGTGQSLPWKPLVTLLRQSKHFLSQRHCSFISPDSIMKLEWFSSHRYPDRFHGKKFLRLAESIKETGVLNPVIVRSRGGTDFYTVKDGNHRTLCCLYFNLTIPAYIIDEAD